MSDPSPPSTSGTVEADIAVDVLVIGAGGCGLVAAIAAHEAGADVAVVEKGHAIAGNTSLSSGSIPGAGTRFQVERGISDDPARFAADLFRVSGDHDAPHLTQRLAETSAELVEWLVDTAGVDLELIDTYRHVGHSVHRLHAPRDKRGTTLMEDLQREVERREIPIAFGNPATSLITAEGAVVGAQTENNRRERVRISSKATILAVNGFGRNRELLRRYCPIAVEAEYAGAATSEGEALRWGLGLGAATGNLGAYQGHASFADPHGVLVTWTLVEKGGIIVDASGARIADESVGYSAFAEQELRRAGPFYVIYDAAICDAVARNQEEFGKLVEIGGAVAADDAEALAARIGFDPSVLADTLGAARAAATGDAPDRFGRTAWGNGPLGQPLRATRITPALFHTQGGLAVDATGRVLDVDGRPIPGLFAGGGAAAGISGRQGSGGYASGNGLLCALGLGFITGRAAAAPVGGETRREAS
ncbi:FAD-dependent oxidoreductase [Stappia stellulata]|uniref:FAD-dependent oxidoreductase n=1 Tax=Stappia stellulata TaxID=71235 RepID=UPI00068416E6|nr:FAD-dependent oxidoreductase [Stappia stellulata]